MVAAGAFTQVQQSLRWFVDNFNTIADWLATFRRVAAFRLALVELGERAAGAGQIERRAAGNARITFDNLSISAPHASAALAETHAEIKPGERVLVTSASRARLTILFRAVAGLWSSGGGRIDLPASEEVMFLPHRPYHAPGPLRHTLSYPSPPNVFRDDELAGRGMSKRRTPGALIASELDRKANWDNELTSDEAQRLAFPPGFCLHKPRWICVDRGLDGLSEAERKKIVTIFDNELAGGSRRRQFQRHRSLRGLPPAYSSSHPWARETQGQSVGGPDEGGKLA